MKNIGIICEYNPLHLGHKKQIDRIRAEFGTGHAIVCLMSGNYVQRGAPAVLDKSLRAKAAILCGADLVLELPVTYALSSAEGFAAGGVGILGALCDRLCFGSETGDALQLMDTARALLSDRFPPLLRAELDTGSSFPAARTAALEKMGLNTQILTRPNDILAVEYCKAILAQGTNMQPMPIVREGSYHAETVNAENPSATAVRRQMITGQDWKACVPEAAAEIFTGAAVHSLAAGERAVLAKLRTMTGDEFEAVPYGSEGLWRKFMRACREQATLDDVTAAVKSKRYTRTRLDRMILCAFLGITRDMLETPAPYIRVLAFNDTGRAVLKEAKKASTFVNAGEAVAHPYWELEQRCGSLYGLFAAGTAEPPNVEEKRRIYYKSGSPDEGAPDTTSGTGTPIPI